MNLYRLAEKCGFLGRYAIISILGFVLVVGEAGAFATGPSDHDIRVLIQDALQRNAESLENFTMVYRYYRLLAVEPESPRAGSFRKSGLYCRNDDQRLLEQVEWAHERISDDSSQRTIRFADGQSSYVWSGWNNTGLIMSNDPVLLNAGGVNEVYSYSGASFFQLFKTSDVSNLDRWTAEDGEVYCSFDLTNNEPYIPAELGWRVHVVLSESYDYFPRLVQTYGGEYLLYEVEITQFERISEVAPLRFFPKSAILRGPYSDSTRSWPPPAYIEIVEVKLDTFINSHRIEFSFPQGCPVRDIELDIMLLPVDESRHVHMDELKPDEIPSFFSDYGLGVSLDEVKFWVDDHK